MVTHLLVSEPTITPQTFWRRAVAVGSLGLAGIFGLWVQPIPAEVMKALPAAPELAPWMLKVLLLINPFVLLLMATLTGAALAQRVGLRSLLAGTASAQVQTRPFIIAGLGGLILGVALGWMDQFLLPWLPDAWQQITRQRPMDGTNLTAAMLYGGLSEEIMLRWGLMSLLAWLMLHWLAMPAHTAMPVAIVLSAFVFGAAHLPAITLYIEPTAALFGRTLLINGLAGVVYGWLFWRYHLEAAMAAHAASHLGMFAVHLMLS